MKCQAKIIPQGILPLHFNIPSTMTLGELEVVYYDLSSLIGLNLDCPKVGTRWITP